MALKLLIINLLELNFLNKIEFKLAVYHYQPCIHA